MTESKAYKNLLEEAREEGIRAGKIKSQKKSNKITLSHLSHPKYKEAIEAIDSINDLEVLDNIFEVAMDYLGVLSELERLAKKLNKDKEETITNEQLYELIIQSNQALNDRIDKLSQE